MFIYYLGSENQVKLLSKHPLPLGPDLRRHLARRTGRGLWSPHVFGMARETALVSQGDRGSRQFPFAEIRAVAVTFHI